MAAKKRTGEQVVRVAPLGELRAYTISEHELEQFEQGGNVSDLLTIGLCLLSAALTVGVTMWSTALPESRYVLFFCALLILGIGGAICTFLGWKLRVSTKQLAAQVRSRMPTAQPVREAPVGEASGGSPTTADAEKSPPSGSPDEPPASGGNPEEKPPSN